MNTRNLTTKQILVLVALSALDGYRRGATIARFIINVTGRHDQLLRSIYAVLKILRRDGFAVRTTNGQWTVTVRGARALDQQLAEFEALGRVRMKLRRVA